MFKYLDVNGALATLSKGTLQFTNSFYFNDPFDCHPSLIDFSSDPGGRYGDVFKDWIRAEKRNTHDRLRENTWICSLSKINDSLLMWSHYANNHKGICSESEWKPIERDLKLVKETGCKYHVCHISAKESVELIRRAKAEGLDVTCETGPHYLVMDDSDLQEDGKFKMNPPLRSKEDRLALIEGIKDGTIDMIATDHAPHSEEEKSKGLSGSAFGIVGLETAFQIMYTSFVKTGEITLEKLVELMAINPRKRFNIPLGNDYTVWNLNKETVIDPEKFLSKGKAMPFEGRKVNGECMLTVCDGEIVYKQNS